MRSLLEKIFLLAFSLFLAAFLLFCLLEAVPALPKALHLTHLHYYALRERYLPDADLILKTRPHYHYQGKFGGDLSSLLPKTPLKSFSYEARYDADGFRNLHGAGKTDAVILGDSYMEIGADDMDLFPSRFEKVSGLKTAGYGMGWYGPFQYLEVFKRYGLRNRPRIVFFCFYEGNDMQDLKEYQQARKGGKYYSFRPLQGLLLMRFFSIIKDAAQNFKPRPEPPEKSPETPDPRLAWITLNGKEFQTAFVSQPDTRPAEEIRNSPEIKQLEELLLEFRTLSLKNGILPVFVFIPTAAHIYLPYSRMPALSGPDFQKLVNARGDMETVLRETVEKFSMTWVSFTEPFKEAAAEGKILYYETDTHWNSEGRQLAAEYLAEFTKQAL